MTLLERYPAIGEKRYTVALLAGCVMPTMFGATNQATVKDCDIMGAKC